MQRLTSKATHTPLRTKRVRSKRSPWITSEKTYAWTRHHGAIRSKNQEDGDEFKRLRNKVNSNIKIAKELYYKQSFTENKNDSRRTWQTINEPTVSRKSNTSSIKELIVNGVSINKTTDLASAFNEHFSTIGPKLENEIPSEANGDKSCLEYLNITDQRFCFAPTNSSQVFSLLNKLRACLHGGGGPQLGEVTCGGSPHLSRKRDQIKMRDYVNRRATPPKRVTSPTWSPPPPCKQALSKSKATGLDKISARLIHECADLICISICKIFNCSLTTGIFPDDWKCAKVTPLFKQGSSSEMNNYRPISAISVVAKVFERITYDQMYAYVPIRT